MRIKTKILGSVEESFVRMLKIGDIFIMAGHPVRLEKVSQMDAWVSRAPGATPTVPRWNAAKMPLSNRVCEEIIAFRGELRERMENGAPDLAAWITQRLDCGKANGELLREMHAAQHTSPRFRPPTFCSSKSTWSIRTITWWKTKSRRGNARRRSR